MANSFKCEVRTSDYAPFVKKIIEANPAEYSNYNDVAAFLLTSPNLTNEQKMLGLFNAAIIFEGLASLNNKIFTAGKAKYIIGLSSSLPDPVMFLSRVAELFPNNRNIEVPKTYGELIEKINSFFENAAYVQRSEIWDRLAKIDLFLKTADYQTEEDRIREGNAALDILIAGINELSDLNPKSLLISTTQVLRKRIGEISSFVPLREIAKEATLNTQIVTLPDGRIAEAFKPPGSEVFEFFDQGIDQNGEYYERWSPVPEDAEIENAHTSEMGYHEADETGNSFQHVFFGDTIGSALKIITRKGSERSARRQDILDELSSLTDPRSQLKITVRPVGSITAERVNRIKQAGSQANKEAVSRRNHETFETPAQENYLKRNLGGKILTLARPDQGFFIEAEILSTGKTFRLYSFGNYAFVHSDNFTEAVDFSNPEHLQEIKRLSVNKDNEMAQLTDAEIETMRKSHLAFQEFMEDLKQDLDQEIGVNDITEKFLNHYSFGTPKQKEIEIPLDQDPEFDLLMHSVPVVQIDTKGNIIEGTQTERKIPLFFTKQKGQRVFGFKSTLPSNEKLITSDGRLIELDGFLEGLGIDQSTLKGMFSTDEKFLDATSILVKQFPNGKLGFRIMRPKNITEDLGVFGQYITDLAAILSLPASERRPALDKFEMERFTFKIYTPESAQGNTLMLSHSTDSYGMIRLKMKPGVSRASGLQKGVYQDLISKDDQSLFTFQLDATPIINLAKAWSLKGKLGQKIIQELKDAGVDLSQFDVSAKEKFPSSPSSVRNFTRWLQDQVNDDKNVPSAKEFLSKIEDAMHGFGQMLKSTVTDKLVSQLEGQRPDILEEMKKHFSVDGEFRPEFLIVDINSEGKFIPKIRYNEKNNVGKEDYYSRISNYKVLSTQHGSGRFQVIAKGTPKDTAARPKVTSSPAVPNYVAPSAPLTKAEPMSFIKIDVIDGIDVIEGAIRPGDVPFELSRGSFESETRAERKTAIQWLKDNYAEFGLEQGDLSEILDLASVDGDVLGAFSNKVIYLNDKLMGKGTVYHEAFHGVFRHLMDTGQRRLLLDTIKKDKKNQNRFSESSLKEFAEARNLNLTEEAIGDLIAEEILAEGFQSFMGDKSSKKSKKQGVLAKFFEMLKKLINMLVQRQAVIEEFYTKVGNGSFSKQTMDSGLFDNQVAFEIIPGIIKHRRQNAGIISTAHVMDDMDRKQLVTMIAGMMLRDNPALSFDQRFERVAERLVKDEFNMTKLLDEKSRTEGGLSPEVRRMIIERYGLLFSNYSFILGGRVKGDVFDVNMTGNPAIDNKNTANNVTVNGEVVSNHDGSHSKAILKKQVAKEISMLSKMLEEREDSSEETLAEINEELANGGTAKKTPDGYDEANEEISGSGDFEASMNEFNRMDSLNRQLRMFLTNIRADVYDAELGITIPRVINAERVFSVLLKISANVEPRFIIQNLLITADQMKEDGNFDVAAELYAIYNTMDELVGLDSKGFPTQNEYLYNMLVDVLHGTEEAMIMVSPYTKIEYIEDFKNVSTNSVMVKDKVLSNDTWVKKRNIVSQMVLTQGFSKNDSAKLIRYTQAAQELKEAIEKIKSGQFMNGTFTLKSSVQLDSIVERLKNNLETVGLSFPKSLIRMSLMAIHKNDFGGTSLASESAEMHYAINLGFVQDKSYLEQDFWRDLEKVLTTAVNKPQSEFKGFLDDINVNNSNLNRFNAILGNASAYIVKYDPDMLPTTVKNAEGKAVFRYTKYTAIRTILEDVRRHGLTASMSKDPYWHSYLREFIEDNSWLNSSSQAQRDNMNLFLSKMDMALFGGVQQKINGVNQEGKGFKDLDDKSMYLSFIMMFMDRKNYSDSVKVYDANGKVIEERASSIETFMRPFSQLEASQTHYVVSGIYKPFVSRVGKAGTTSTGETAYNIDGEQYTGITKVLEDTVKQEFARIQREYARSKARKEDFDSRKGNEFILNFNAVLDKSDNSLADIDPDAGQGGLRAYKLNKLDDYFGGEGADLAKSLQEVAFAGTSYESMEPGLKKDLRKALQGYAKKQFQNHLAKLESTGVIRSSPVEGIPNKFTYNSDFLPDHIKYPAGKKVKISDVYGKEGMENFLKDAFYNVWANSLMLNDIFDGDKAMSVKNGIDYFKRNKKHLAASSNMKEGYHKVAYTNTITAYVYSEHPEFGTYNSLDEILNDLSLTREMKELMHKDYLEVGPKELVFDGQSVSSVMHQMDMMESIGRLDHKSKAIMMAKHFRKLTDDEINHLKSMNIVMNAKKTVTAARFNYHKLSEVHIDRNDVSKLVLPEGMTTTKAYETLMALYDGIYAKRKIIQRSQITGEDGTVKTLREEIKSDAEKIHGFFEPLPHRVKLHDLLNSMEYFQIDQMMDTEASKNATLLPMDLLATPRIDTENGNAYLNLEHSSIEVENRFKYLQVETSGVKDTAKFSVQSKALLPADLLNIKDMIIAENGVLTAEEEKSFLIVEDILANYQSSLRQVGESMSTKFKTFLRKDGDFNIGKVYQMIRESLVEQNAPSSRVELFDLLPSGEPKFSPNLPAIRVMLEYYFFSQYSKNVTDEKGAGFKNIHISGYGYEVLVDESDQVIPTHLYKASPESYPNVRSRSLKASVETDANGVKTYFMEVIMPMPKFESRDHEKFYMEHLSKMYATRIPTEDKRSMFAIKVVDFIDGANASGIVVPHAVHMLSGSDFDVDAVYGQMKAHYKGLDEKFRVYGDYSAAYNDKSESIGKLKAMIKDLTSKQGISETQKADNLKYAEKLTAQIEIEKQEHSKFLEFFNYFSTDKELKGLIKERHNDIIEKLETSPILEVGNATLEIMALMGHSKEEVRLLQEMIANKDEYKRIFDATKKHFDGVKDDFLTLNSFITDILAEIEEEKSVVKTHYDKAKELNQKINLEERKTSSDSKLLSKLYDQKDSLERSKPDPDVLKMLYVELKAYSKLKNEHGSAKKDMLKYRTVLNTVKQAQKIYKIQAIADVFSQYGLPVTASGFKSRPEYSVMVTSVYQNNNLNQKIRIISNEMVFRNLYINERASAEAFEKIMKAYGLTIEDVSSNSNAYTMDAVIATKKTTSMNKDGIGITANINKFLSLSSTYQLELAEAIWDFTTQGKRKIFSKFGFVNESNERTIALIGNVLGMFADGSKKPIPAALRMNQYNATVTLAMIGVGVDPEFAVGFNFLPGVQRAVMAVQSSDTAIGSEADNDLKKLDNELRNQIIDLVKENKKQTKEASLLYDKLAQEYSELDQEMQMRIVPPVKAGDVLQELVEAGLISDGSNEYSGIKIDKSNLNIEFNPQVLDKYRLDTLQLTPFEIGYVVSSNVEGSIPLSGAAQSLILLELYRQQAQQTNEMRKAGALINLFKSLNPSFTSFDAMRANIEQLMDPERSIFTFDSIQKLQDETQVWHVLIEMMEDLHQQSALLFIERGGFLGKVKELFETVISDPAEIAKVMTSFVGINAFLKNYPGSRSAGVTDPSTLEFLRKDDENLLEIFTPDFWFHSGKDKTDAQGNKIITFSEELDLMKQKFPRNSFLNSIVEKKDVVSTYFNTATNQNEQITMNYFTLAGTSKKNNTEQIMNDFNSLLRHESFSERLFMKKLFYHELARTAMMGSPGSFIQFMTPDLQLPISKEIEKFSKGLKQEGNVASNLAKSLGLDNQYEMADMFDNLFMQLVYKAVENPKNKRIPTVKSLPINSDKVENLARNFDTDIKFDKKNIKPYARLAAELYDHIFGFKISKAENISFPELKISATDANIVKNGLKFNLLLPEKSERSAGMTGRSMDFVAKQFGIKKSMAPGTKGQYEFPIIIRVEGGFLKLKQVDTRVPHETTGHAILDALQKGTSFSFVGMTAKYDFLPDNSVPSFLSPVGFSTEATNRFKKIKEAGLNRQGVKYSPGQTPVSQAPVVPVAPVVYQQPVDEEFDVDAAAADSKMLKGLLKPQQKAPVRVSKMSTIESPLEIYADGNDFKGSGNMGYGAAYKFNNKWYSLSGTEIAPKSLWLKNKHPDASWSNPTTELMGTVAVLHSFADTAEHLVIKQDFNGIVNWGELWNYSEGSEQRQAKPWKIKEPYIKTLHDSAIRLIKQIEANGGSVRLQWVKGHNGIEGNEIADQAAKNRGVFNEFVSGIETADRLALDINALNMTSEVLEAIYQNSTRSKSREEFEKTALQIVAALRATQSPIQIIEQLKCL